MPSKVLVPRKLQWHLNRCSFAVVDDGVAAAADGDDDAGDADGVDAAGFA